MLNLCLTFLGWTMHSSSAWLGWGQKNTSGWASQIWTTLMNLCGQKEMLWRLLTGTLECQVRRKKAHISKSDRRRKINNWISPQGSQQGCVAMTTGILAGLWDLLPCSSTVKYICKHLAEGAVLTVPPPTQAPPACQEGWTRVGTRNYCAKVQEFNLLNMTEMIWENETVILKLFKVKLHSYVTIRA